MKLPNYLTPRLLVLATILFALLATSMHNPQAQQQPLYLDASQPLEVRVEDLLSRMTFEEKLLLVRADSKFSSAAIPRLGIPRRWLSDGPHGVREDVGPDTWKPAGRTDDFASWMPALIGLAASFNEDLSRAYGDVIGEEALQRGKQIMLGPGVNIMRTPLNGRNFEYFGEDPYLASRMAVSYIRAVQSHNVASCVKHFAGNNQETERGSIDVEMDERTLREIYLPAFKAAVQEGNVWAVMGAYNRFRGQYACHNDYLLNKVLKGDWGFKGLVMSDWDGTHDTREAVLNGLDLEMGTEKPYEEFYLARGFREGLQKGEFPQSVLDDKVRRNLRQMIAIRALDGRGTGALNTKAHQETARRVAEESVVLLKNEGSALPLDVTKINSIAVIGENAVQLQAYGGGSSRIKTFYEITPLEGIVRRAGERVNVTYSTGYRAESNPDLLTRAVRAASQADVAIVIGGLNHSRNFDAESWDRKDMKLPYGQDELIQRVVEANPRTIVVFLGGGPVEMGPWLGRVPALMQAWYLGMEGGNALARVLFGDVNPSGKLPCTFPKRLEDSPAHALDAYPGKNGKEPYKEGLLVGYRWFDTRNIEPLFPFGFGLSYTNFQYANLKLTAGSESQGAIATAQFEISNSGAREGSEVVQVYVQQLQPRVTRPVKELKAFRKVMLKAGEKQTVTIPLERAAFSYYDPERKGWAADAGEFTILIGASSRDLRLQGTFRLPQSLFEAEGVKP